MTATFTRSPVYIYEGRTAYIKQLCASSFFFPPLLRVDWKYIRKRGDKVHLFPPITTLNVGIASCNTLFKCLAVKVEERTLVNFRSDEWKWKLLEKVFFGRQIKELKGLFGACWHVFLTQRIKHSSVASRSTPRKKAAHKKKRGGKRLVTLKAFAFTFKVTFSFIRVRKYACYF